MDCIQNRRSIRKYKDTPIDRQAIEEIVKAGMLAPSAKNRQPWKYIIYSGDSKAELLGAMERGLLREKHTKACLPLLGQGLPDAFHTLEIMRQAPVLAVVLNANGKPMLENLCTDERVMELCDALSIGASIENMLLKATELGIGSLWIANTYFAWKELTEYIDTPHHLIGAVVFGYAKESPNARPRKELKDILEFR